MKLSALEHFACPDCRAPGLKLTDQELHENGTVLQGTLACDRCGNKHRLKDGIPRFVPDEEYAGSFGFQWNKFRKTQVDSHTGLPLSSDRLFRVTGWPRNMAGELILEAGSGAGRFTEILLGTEAELFSFDLSNAVEANLANNGNRKNLNLFQGGIFDIPFRPGSFDKVICLGVLQHTPDPERAFHALTAAVRPGGKIAIDIYASRLRSMLSWKYLLRPLTTRMPKDRLFRYVEQAVRVCLPVSLFLRRVGGRFGARLLPIVEYSHLGLAPDLNREWAVLDTFDMYSPTHDHPRSIRQVRQWLESAELEDIVVEYGPNGVVARGKRRSEEAIAESQPSRVPPIAKDAARTG